MNPPFEWHNIFSISKIRVKSLGQQNFNMFSSFHESSVLKFLTTGTRVHTSAQREVMASQRETKHVV